MSTNILTALIICFPQFSRTYLKQVRTAHNRVPPYILQLIFQKLSYYLTPLNKCY